MNWDAYVGPLPWFTYDGSTGAHRFGWGDINWGQHHYDIVQWGIGGDNTGPVEIRLENGMPVFRYANGVEVYGCSPPGEAWDAGRGVFRRHRGQITVHREKSLLRSAGDCQEKPPVRARPGVYYSTSHSGNFLECVRTRQQTICNAE